MTRHPIPLSQPDPEFYPVATRSGYNFGKSLSFMVSSLLSEREQLQFLLGVKKSIDGAIIYRQRTKRDPP